MPWFVLAGAVVSAITAANDEQRRQFEQHRRDLMPFRTERMSCGPSLAQLVREHEARMAAMHAETMRSAKVGMVLLLALAGASIYCVAQFFV